MILHVNLISIIINLYNLEIFYQGQIRQKLLLVQNRNLETTVITLRAMMLRYLYFSDLFNSHR